MSNLEEKVTPRGEEPQADTVARGCCGAAPTNAARNPG